MTQNNSSKKNEVNLNQIFNLILDAKILFISIIILSTAIATYIAVSKPILFNSIAVIELGHYYDSQGNKKQIENKT